MKNIYFIVEGKTEKIFIDAIRKLETMLKLYSIYIAPVQMELF